MINAKVPHIALGAIVFSILILGSPAVHAKAAVAGAVAVQDKERHREIVTCSEANGVITCSNSDVIITAGSTASISGSGNTITLEPGGFVKQGDVFILKTGAVAKLINDSASNTFNIKRHLYTVKKMADVTYDQNGDLEVKYINANGVARTEFVSFLSDGSYQVRVSNSMGYRGLIVYDAKCKAMKLSGKIDEIAVSNSRITITPGSNVSISGSGNTVSFEKGSTSRVH